MKIGEERCPSCGLQSLRFETRITVGGRTLIKCDNCGTSMVDDNQEPSSCGGLPIEDTS